MIKKPIAAEVAANFPLAAVSGLPWPAPIIIDIPPKRIKKSMMRPAMTKALERIMETRSARPLPLPNGDRKMSPIST